MTPDLPNLLLAWLIYTSWQASVLIALVLLAQVLFGRWLSAGWRYALWSLVVVRLLLPTVPASPLSIFNLLEHKPTAATVAMRALQPAAIAPAAVPARSTPLPETAEPLASLDWQHAIVLVWLLGMIAYLTWMVAANRRLRRKVAALPDVVDPALLCMLERCKRQMQVAQRLRVVKANSTTSPALVGWWHPTVLLPAELCATLSRRELRFVLLHELAHVKHHDVAIHWLLTALQAVHWWNPMIWFAFARMRSDRELACDALVLVHTRPAEQRDYGLTIIKVLQHVAQPPRRPALVTLGCKDNASLQRRIVLISKFAERKRWFSSTGIVVLAAVGCLGLTGVEHSSPAPEGVVESVKFSAAGAVPTPFALSRASAQGIALVPRPATPLTGLLHKPAGAGPFPAVVLLHGCRGIQSHHGDWARTLADWGYLVLQVDSLGPRGLTDYCTHLINNARANARFIVPDAYAALAYLRTQPFVQPERIAVMGWSQWAALASVLIRGPQQFYDDRFQAVVAISPDCGSTASGEFYAPVLVLIGEKDDWSPAARCESMARNGASSPNSITLKVYPDAHHDFDNPAAGERSYYAETENLYKSPAKGATLGYDRTAHRDALQRVRTFLLKHLTGGSV